MILQCFEIYAVFPGAVDFTIMSIALPLAGFDDKQVVSASVMHDDFEYTNLPSEKAGTVVDRRDMARMGRTQEFRV